METVHSHTLAVELAARLLENGILEPITLPKEIREQLGIGAGEDISWKMGNC